MHAVHDPPVAFRRKTPLVIAFTDPNICIAGAPWGDVEDDGPAVGRARFTGEVRAIPEGRLFFKDEPILEVTAPIPVAQLIETYDTLRGAEKAAAAAERMRRRYGRLKAVRLDSGDMAGIGILATVLVGRGSPGA